MKKNNHNVKKKRHDSKSRREQILILSQSNFLNLQISSVLCAYVEKFRIRYIKNPRAHSHFLQRNQIKASDEGDNTNFVVSLSSSNGTFLDQNPYLPQSILREDPAWFDSNEGTRNKSATWLRRTSPYRKTYD